MARGGKRVGAGRPSRANRTGLVPLSLIVVIQLDLLVMTSE